MELLEELEGLGVNVNEGVERLMGNASLYVKMLGMFVNMMRTLEVSPDFDGNDYKDMIEKAHAVKGAAGNLSITPVYEAYTEIVNLLRADQPEQARAVLKKILPLQADIIQCIERYR